MLWATDGSPSMAPGELARAMHGYQYGSKLPFNRRPMMCIDKYIAARVDPSHLLHSPMRYRCDVPRVSGLDGCTLTRADNDRLDIVLSCGSFDPRLVDLRCNPLSWARHSHRSEHHARPVNVDLSERGAAPSHASMQIMLASTFPRASLVCGGRSSHRPVFLHMPAIDDAIGRDARSTSEDGSSDLVRIILHGPFSHPACSA